MQERGIDRHEWEREWAGLEPLLEASPAGALPEVDGLVGRTMCEQLLGRGLTSTSSV